MTVGEKIKMLRMSADMSQDELAKRCGLHTATAICYYESNKRKVPYHIIAKVSDIFGVTPNYLMGFSNKSVDMIKLSSIGFTQENIDKLDKNDLMKLEAYLQALLDAKK